MTLPWLDCPGLTILFTKTSRPKTGREGIHLDLVGSVYHEEVDRVVSLGASIKSERDGYTVLRDPEGNEFCIQDPDGGER